MNSLTFGRYVSLNTPLHRLDPRSKILFLILLMVMVFLPFDVWSTKLIFSLAYLFIFIVVMILGRISFKSFFKSLKAMWFLVLFLLIMYLFIPNSSYLSDYNAAVEQYGDVAKNLILFKFSDTYIIYWFGVFQAVYILLRLILMIALTMVLTSTTKPLDLTFALEWYMTPLKLVKFPAHIVSMMISIALRFIPTILEETERIMKAQASRGVDFSHGGLIKKFKAVISLIIPLFISAFERSEQLGDAMEARGYDPKGKRTSYHKLRFHVGDLIGLIVVSVLFGCVLYMSIAHRDINILNDVFNLGVPF